MTDRLDVVAIRVEYESAIVVRVVAGAQTRFAVVRAARSDRSRIKAVDSCSVCGLYFLMTLGCSLGSTNCFPSFDITQGSPVALRSFSELSSCDPFKISRLTRLSRRFATRLSDFSLDAQVFPAIGVLLRDLDMVSQSTRLGLAG